MKVEKIGKREVIEFSSLGEFYNYICETPFNEAFRWAKHSSVDGSKDFTGTNSFEEAVELFKNGWDDMAKQLVKKINANKIDTDIANITKNVLDVCGYQAIVPLYLQGVPNSMVNKKIVKVKQKVITINKSIDYSGYVTIDKIIEESIKAMQIIKKIEAQGVRCNLNIVFGSKRNNEFYLKIRVKNASEKLNVSKLAFPLVNPSMLRRLLFRFIEVYPNFDKSFVNGYGRPSKAEDWKELLNGKEYYIPSILNKEIDEINSLNDLI